MDVSGLTTAESADDLEALRLGLGVPRIALLAGSYGTHLALAAMRRHPGSIARVALLGVEGPDHTLKSPLRIDEVLARIAATRRPSLADDIRTLRRRFSEAPVRFTFSTGQTLALSEWDLQRRVADALDTEREIDAMLTALPAILEGSYTEVARSALPYRLPRVLNLMNVAVDCASSASPERLARIRAEGAEALLGNVMDFPLPELCEAAGLLPLPSDFRTPVESEVPALLFIRAGKRLASTNKERHADPAPGVDVQPDGSIGPETHRSVGHAAQTPAQQVVPERHQLLPFPFEPGHDHRDRRSREAHRCGDRDRAYGAPGGSAIARTGAGCVRTFARRGDGG